MVDYSIITEEEITKRTGVMPAPMKAVYESDSFGFELLKIANDSFFDENEAIELQMLVGLYMMGFMKEQDLSDQISEDLYLEPEESDKMVEKIRDLIRDSLNPPGETIVPSAAVTPESKPAYAPPKTTFVPPSFTPPANNFLKPQFYEVPSSAPIAPAPVKVDFNVEPKTKSVMTSPDIHPENIIDLKDLPK